MNIPVRCPNCSTRHAVDLAVLAESDGDVRCGRCGEVFVALAHALDAESGRRLRKPGSDRSPPVLQVAGQTALPIDTAHHEPMLAVADDEPVTLFAAADKIDRHARRKSLLWMFFLTISLIVLAAQLLWHYRSALREIDALAPAWALVCDRVDCDVELDLAEVPAYMQLESRNIAPHPRIEGALVVSATLRQASGARQPFPAIELTLSNYDDRPVASRAFQPREYIDDPAALQAGLAPNVLVPIELEIMDPGETARAYEFKFLRARS